MPTDQRDDGLSTFSMHAFDTTASNMFDGLREERGDALAPGSPAGEDLSALDPETAARRHLEHALTSAAVPALTVPTMAGTTSQFTSPIRSTRTTTWSASTRPWASPRASAPSRRSRPTTPWPRRPPTRATTPAWPTCRPSSSTTSTAAAPAGALFRLHLAKGARTRTGSVLAVTPSVTPTVSVHTAF